MAYSKIIIAEARRLHKKGNSILSISRDMGINRATITKFVRDQRYTTNGKVNELLNKMQDIEDKSHETLLEMLESKQYANITKTAISLLTKENLQNEIESRGIRSIIALMGNSYDKTLALSRLHLDTRKVDLAERTLQLKEQELQARIDNPEAFSNIVIVKDTDEIALRYEEEARQDYARD
jgi:hypothetical protein